MIFLPFEKIELHSSKQPVEIEQLLSARVGESTVFSNWQKIQTKEYVGKVDSSSFKIRRVISYRNSSQPILYGRYNYDPDGTKVIIKMRMHILVIIFLTVWFGTLVFAGFNANMSYSNTTIEEVHPVWVLFTLAYSLILIFFKVEAKKSMAYLEELLVND